MPRSLRFRAASRARRVGLLVAACLCATPVAAATAGEVGASQATVAIHVTSNGWHSSIVVPRAALPSGTLPEADDFPGAAYLSLGWGDAAYFPAREPGLGLTLGAALRPTPAVLHMAGLAAHPREVFPAEEVVELRLAADGFARLVAYLDATVDRAGAARAQASQPGLFSFSRFYPATGKFHLFNTCNTRTARGLAAAGLPVEPGGVMTAEDLMAQLRR